MAKLTSEAVNRLIYAYFKDEGLDLAAKALLADAHIDINPGAPCIPRKEQHGSSELVKLLLRGIESVSIESLVDANSPAPQLDFGLTETAKTVGGSMVFAFQTPEQLLLVCSENKLTILHTDKTINIDLPGLVCLDKVGEGFVLIGQKSGTVSLLNSSTCPVTVFPPQNLGSAVLAVSVSPGNRAHACICSDFFATWPVSEQSQSEESEAEPSTEMVVEPENNEVTKTPIQLSDPNFGLLTWLGDETLAVVQNEAVLIIGVSNGKHTLKRELKRHLMPIKQLIFDHNAHFLVSASLDGVLCVWTAESEDPKSVIKAHAGEITGLQICGEFLMTASTDGLFKVFNSNSSELVCEFDTGCAIKKLCISSSNQIALLTESGVLKLAFSNNELSLKAHLGLAANDIVFLGEQLAVAGSDTTIYT